MAKAPTYFAGVGRRKSAIAQVRVTSGNGLLVINGQTTELPEKLKNLLLIIGRLGQIDLSVVTRGGGLVGQIDATLLGTARALVELNPDWRSALRKAGYLTRDARVKERKKPGLKGARRAPQWAKR